MSRGVVVLAVLLLGAVANIGFAASDSVSLRWFGQAFFLITTGGGTRIAIDPYGEIGYPLPTVEADAVFITHEHRDHNNAGLVRGGPKVFRGLSTNPPGWNSIRERIGDALIYGVPAFHDNEGGTTPRGLNTLFVVEANGVRFAHLGDLGQTALTDGQLRAMGKIDVLLIPVGHGPFTIGGADAQRIADQIGAPVVIPMHFKTAAMPAEWPGRDEQAFLAGKTNVRRSGSTLIFSRAAIPSAS